MTIKADLYTIIVLHLSKTIIYYFIVGELVQGVQINMGVGKEWEILARNIRNV